jgi:hypothetical protein
VKAPSYDIKNCVGKAFRQTLPAKLKQTTSAINSKTCNHNQVISEAGIAVILKLGPNQIKYLLAESNRTEACVSLTAGF